ncbi:MAG: OsmC family protein [Bacteroidota bacterium]|nr:OsmC family protein [Bacteroidota bacterium]
MRVEVQRMNENYGIEARNEAGKTFIIDNNKAGGGDDLGFRPMQSLLAALGGCSSIDVISILKKQKLEPFDLKVIIDGERETGKDANLWKTVHAHFIFKGTIPKEKAQRAVELSITKYCSVSKTLEAGGTKITSSVEVLS